MQKGTKEPTLTISVRTVLACARPTVGSLASRQRLLRRAGTLPYTVRLSTASDSTIIAFSWVSRSGEAASPGPFWRGLAVGIDSQFRRTPVCHLVLCSPRENSLMTFCFASISTLQASAATCIDIVVASARSDLGGVQL